MKPYFWLFPIALVLTVCVGFAFSKGYYSLALVLQAVAWYILGWKHGLDMVSILDEEQNFRNRR